MRQLLTCLFLLFFGRIGATPEYHNFWIIWNVGQGQWITQVTPSECRHFDFGGEIYYFKNIQKRFMALCSSKNNKLYLSHADLDHYSFLNLIINRTKSICWMVRPDRFQHLSLKIPKCISKGPTATSMINQTITIACRYKDKNSCSTVFKRNRFLIPGDSPKSQEKHWSPLLQNKNQIEVLVLGHHGSQTSTKATLIGEFINLKMAVASARKAKYGHPHAQTEKTLKNLTIPLLRTESWGNLVFL